MSVSIIIVNLQKREYLRALPFGEELTDKNYIKGRTATALAMLTCDTRLCVHLESPGGSWCGDRVAAVSDAGVPDAEGFHTTTAEEPKRNLYSMVLEEFRDISLEAVAMVCDRFEETAEELVLLANEEIHRFGVGGNMLFLYLGRVVSATNSDALESALRRHFGEAWRQFYRNEEDKESTPGG